MFLCVCLIACMEAAPVTVKKTAGLHWVWHAYNSPSLYSLHTSDFGVTLTFSSRPLSVHLLKLSSCAASIVFHF